MATEFLMPKLGLTMEEGKITEWFADDGAAIAAGSPLLRIETDKTETEVEAAGSGRLYRVGQVGDTFACGDRIGWFLEDGEEAPEVATAGPAPQAAATAATRAAVPPAEVATVTHSSSGRIVASPLAKRLARERNLDLRSIRGTGPDGRIVAADLDNVVAVPAPAATGRPTSAFNSPSADVPATAAARALADLLGIDLAVVAVDPIEGRITKDAVAVHVRTLLAERARPIAAPEPVLLPALQEPTDTIRMSGIRGTIAKRMHDSLRQMAQLTLFMDAEMDAVVADRASRKASGSAPSFTDYVIAATARALRDHPLVNSQITDDGVALLPTAHIGMAVALDDGLIVPVIRDVAARDLASLSTESARLATAARSGSLAFADLEGGTFSVSTLGMYGVDGFTPVINPPNTAILGVGRLRSDVVLDNGEVRARQRLTLSLTWDHRAFDGAPAAAFCRSVVELLANPAALDAPAT